jgi:hypothetical protein
VQTVREVSQKQEADEKQALHNRGAEKRELKIPLRSIDARQSRRPDAIEIYTL